MTLSVGVLLPLGAMWPRLLAPIFKPRKKYFHHYFTLSGFVMAIAGVCLTPGFATGEYILHKVLGILIMSLLTLQVNIEAAIVVSSHD